MDTSNWLLQLAAGFLGLFMTIIIMTYDYIADGEFDWKVFWCKHKIPTIFVGALLVLLSLTINLIPDAGDVLKTITLMDVTSNPRSFLLLGATLYGAVYTKIRSRARSKERKKEELEANI